MGLSLRAYAAHRRASGLPGGTHRAVRMAIAAGRITAAPDGGIADAAQADAQWSATTRADRVPHTGRGARAAPPRPADDPEGFSNPMAKTPADPPPAPSRLQLLREEREAIAVERARFEFDRMRGKYVLVEDARAEVERDYGIVKNHLLSLHAHVGQYLSREDALRVCPIVLRLVHEALEQLADGLPHKRAGLPAPDELPPRGRASNHRDTEAA